MSEVAYQGARKRIVWASDTSSRKHGKEYFDELPRQDKAKLQVLFERMADQGEVRNTQKFRVEKDGFYCFKSFQRRLMCFFDGDDIVITQGFTKKRDKLDSKELDRAARIKDNYKRP